MIIHSHASTPYLRNQRPQTKRHQSHVRIPTYNPSQYLSQYNLEHLISNYALPFKGNAPKINNAFILATRGANLPLLQTKANDSFVVDFDSQTEIIYGLDAIKFLEKKTNFDYETQVIFPKKATGTMKIGAETLELQENTAVLINPNADIEFTELKGYPVIVLSKKDYDWYARYGQDLSLKEKFAEVESVNKHLYNGGFHPNELLNAALLSSLESQQNNDNQPINILVSGSIDTSNLSETQIEQIKSAKSLINLLFKNRLLSPESEGYIKFNSYNWAKDFENLPIDKEQKKLLKALNARMFKILESCKEAKRIQIANYPSEILEKMLKAGVLEQDGQILYWKEYDIKKIINKPVFSCEEKKLIAKNWDKENLVGYDLTGIRFLSDDVAVYNLDDKINNWTRGETNWVTNSITTSSRKGKAPFIGVSMVQSKNGDEGKIIPMSKLREQEHLHFHPNEADKKQTEIYLVTSGAAALNVVKNGKSSIEIVNEGEMAVVPAGMHHCINSVLGEYEQVVVQLPSVFQYGYAFKKEVDQPEGYNEADITKQANKKLGEILVASA